MQMSKLKHLQRYTNPFEIYHRKFERIPQRHKISTIFTSTTDEVFETLETADADMTTYQSIIEPIVNRNFGNIFQHQNGPNQQQNIHQKNIQ